MNKAQRQEQVQANLAASRAAREASRLGKRAQMAKVKPFKAYGPDSVLRDGYTLSTNLRVDRYGYCGWTTGKNSVQLDLRSKPVRHFRRAAARLRGKKLELKKIVDHLEDLINQPNKERGYGVRLLGLNRLEDTSQRHRVPASGADGVHKLSDFVRFGLASNLEKLLLMQVGLQAAGIKSKIVGGEASWQKYPSKYKVPMWIEVSHGAHKPDVIAAEYGYLGIVDRSVDQHLFSVAPFAWKQ